MPFVRTQQKSAFWEAIFDPENKMTIFVYLVILVHCVLERVSVQDAGLSSLLGWQRDDWS